MFSKTIIYPDHLGKRAYVLCNFYLLGTSYHALLLVHKHFYSSCQWIKFLPLRGIYDHQYCFQLHRKPNSMHSGQRSDSRIPGVLPTEIGKYNIFKVQNLHFIGQEMSNLVRRASNKVKSMSQEE